MVCHSQVSVITIHALIDIFISVTQTKRGGGETMAMCVRVSLLRQ